jgi:hypothetical protein
MPDIPTPPIHEPLFHISQLDGSLSTPPSLFLRSDHERHRLQRWHRREDVVPYALRRKPTSFFERKGKMLNVFHSLDVLHQGMKLIWQTIERTEKDSVTVGFEMNSSFRLRLMLLLTLMALRFRAAAIISNRILDVWK